MSDIFINVAFLYQIFNLFHLDVLMTNGQVDISDISAISQDHGQDGV